MRFRRFSGLALLLALPMALLLNPDWSHATTMLHDYVGQRDYSDQEIQHAMERRDDSHVQPYPFDGAVPGLRELERDFAIRGAEEALKRWNRSRSKPDTMEDEGELTELQKEAVAHELEETLQQRKRNQSTPDTLEGGVELTEWQKQSWWSKTKAQVQALFGMRSRNKERDLPDLQAQLEQSLATEAPTPQQGIPAPPGNTSGTVTRSPFASLVHQGRRAQLGTTLSGTHRPTKRRKFSQQEIQNALERWNDSRGGPDTLNGPWGQTKRRRDYSEQEIQDALKRRNVFRGSPDTIDGSRGPRKRRKFSQQEIDRAVKRRSGDPSRQMPRDAEAERIAHRTPEQREAQEKFYSEVALPAAKELVRLEHEDLVLAGTGLLDGPQPGPADVFAVCAVGGRRAAKALKVLTTKADNFARARKVTDGALKTARREFGRVKQKFWKSEAMTNAGKHSTENLARMKKGKAPIGADGHSMELHHKTPLAEGGSNAFDNLRPMTRTEHRLGPNYKLNHPNQP